MFVESSKKVEQQVCYDESSRAASVLYSNHVE